MKSLEELKQEQCGLKAKLHKIMEIINSEEYFTLTPKEKGLISQQRVGMELYLNALTNRIYGKEDYSFDASSTMFIPMLTSLLTPPSWSNFKDNEEKQTPVTEG